MLERRDVADDDPNVAGRVLRLRKTKTEPSSFGEDVARDGARDDALEPRSNALTDASLWASHPGFENARSAEDRSCAFAHHVMRPLLGDRFVDPGAFAPVDRAFLGAVADAVEPARPRARRALSRIDPAATRAALAPDARRVDRVRVGAEDDGRGAAADAAADWFSVEIKPKCGFALPGDPESTSRFAMHQALRVRSGEGAARARTTRWTCSRGATIRARGDRRRRIDDAPQTRVTRARRRAAEQPPRRAARVSVAAGHDAAVFRSELRLLGRVRVSHGWTRDRSRRETGRRGASAGPRERRARGVGRPRRAPARAAPGHDRRGSRGRAVRIAVCVRRKRVVRCRVRRREKEKEKGVRDGGAARFRRRRRRQGLLRTRRVSRRRTKSDDDAFDDDGTFAVAAAAEGGTLPRVRYRCRVSVVDVDLKPIANISKWLATHRRIARNWANEKRAARSDAQQPSDDESTWNP